MLCRCMLLLVLLSQIPLRAQEKKVPGRINQVQYLVESLASKNPEPQGQAGDLKLSPNYSRDAQAFVYLARQRLLHEGSAACDELVKHFDDKRYSYSDSGSDGEFNFTMGNHCKEIFDLILRPYQHEIHLISFDQEKQLAFIYSDPVAWWKANRERPLWELQIEQIDLAIKYFQEANAKTATSIRPFVRPLAPEVFDLRRGENIATLQKLRESIAIRQAPYVTSKTDHKYGVFFYLPWPVNTLNK